jgi:hypothetical protein
MQVVFIVCSLLLLWAGAVTCVFELLVESVLCLPTHHTDDDYATHNRTVKIIPVGMDKLKQSIVIRQQPTCTFTQNKTVHLLSMKAAQSVRQAWPNNTSTDLLKVPSHLVDRSFCDIIYMPELDMCTPAMSRLAIDTLEVDTTLVSPQNMKEFREFAYCLKQQRPRLNVHRHEKFDRTWGIDANVHFAVGLDSRVDVLLKSEMDLASRRDVETFTKLKLMSVPTSGCPVDGDVLESFIGTHLLHSFVLDLLGRHSPAACVYRNKTIEK